MSSLLSLALAAAQLQEALLLGHVSSRAPLAWMLAFGRQGVAKDRSKAFELAEQGARLALGAAIIFAAAASSASPSKVGLRRSHDKLSSSLHKLEAPKCESNSRAEGPRLQEADCPHGKMPHFRRCSDARSAEDKWLPRVNPHILWFRRPFHYLQHFERRQGQSPPKCAAAR